jgi:hypothetical protein
MTLWLDFETRSRCDLKTAGVYNYAQDGDNEVAEHADEPSEAPRRRRREV